MGSYPQLRTHSYYTLLGATPSPEELAQRALEEGISAVALVDANALYGAVAFDRACRQRGVKPILGLTVTVGWPDAIDPAPPDASTAAELVLLARTSHGYRSLCRLASLVQGDAHRRERANRGLTLDELTQSAAGLICITGGRRGFCHRCLQHAANSPVRGIADAAACERAAHRYLGRLSGIYGPEYTFVGLEVQGPQEIPLIRELSDKASFLGLKTVVAHPVYAISPGDGARLRLLAAINHNCRLDHVAAETLPDGGRSDVAIHWLAPDRLAERYAVFPEALAHTHEVAAACSDRTLPDNTLKWPTLRLPPGNSEADALRRQALSGAEGRYGTPLPAKVAARLAHELGAINLHGYAPLFMVVADIARYARDHEIPISTRGSVANSLVAYALRITTVDPIEHGLLFERFLSPGRSDPPDIDLDFCSRRRDAIQAYIRRTYGEDSVALVGAMSTLQLRSAGRETAKAYGLSDGRTRQLLRHLPRRFHPRHSMRAEDEVLSEIADPELRTVARAAYGIAGFPHHLSIHAGGLVITPGPLTDLVPVQMAPKGFLTTQYGHEDCEAIGLPKLDLLGIRALTVLADAEAAARSVQPGFRLADIPLDDPATAEAVARGDTIGVFQCDSVGARRTLRKLRARTIRDLAVANAFFKPGPATGGQADAFVRRYRGEAKTRYQHAALAPILAPTKGVLIFQEQVLRVATEVAGLSWAEADHIRRGMSKMRPAEMRQLADAFTAGCQRSDGPGLSAEQAHSLWEQVSAFSGYGFNQGHATAYADVSYRSTYLKVHFPAAFFWARLRNYGGYHHPAVYMAEAIRMGIDVRLPHVNHSRARVVLDRGDSPASPALWLGLGQIRDLRRAAVASIVRARRDGTFANLRELLTRVNLQSKEIEHLIKSGAVDGLGPNRPAMLAEAETMNRAGDARQLAFDFASGYAPPATAAQRLAWERRLVGYPLQALREALADMMALYPTVVSVAELPTVRGPTAAAGVRLPGWHRGGFALWDGATWCWAASDENLRWPREWDPTVFSGHWRQDRWGIGWMQVTSCEAGLV